MAAQLSCNKTHFISIESVTFGPNSTCEPVAFDLKCANDISAITRIKMKCNGNTRCDLSDTEDDYTSKCFRNPRHIQISQILNGRIGGSLVNYDLFINNPVFTVSVTPFVSSNFHTIV